MGVGDSWGTREELLHPRDKNGRFRNTWKMASGVIEKILATLSSFNPKTFTSDGEAASYVHGQARSNRFLTNRGPAIERFLKDYSKINADVRAGRPNADAAAIKKGMGPLPEDLILSRVMGPEAFGLNAQNAGQIEELTGKLVTDKGFSSTNVGSPMPKTPGQITMSIVAPKGTRGMFPSTTRPTREVILDTDQPYRITKVDPDGQGGFYVYAVATGESNKESAVDIRNAVPGANVEEGPGEVVNPPDGGTGEVTPAGGGVTSVGPAGTGGAGERNEGHVGIVGQGAGGGTGEVGPEPPETPEEGTDTRSTFRDAFAEAAIKVPTVGNRRNEFNDAYLGVTSGKKTPQEAVRDLDDKIALNKRILASDAEDGTDSGPLAEDIKRQEALSDLIKEHFNFTGRKTQKVTGEETKTPAKKATKKAAPPEKVTVAKKVGTAAGEPVKTEKIRKATGGRKKTPLSDELNNAYTRTNMTQLRELADSNGIKVPGDKKTKRDVFDFIVAELKRRETGEEPPEVKVPEKKTPAKKAMAVKKAVTSVKKTAPEAGSKKLEDMTLAELRQTAKDEGFRVPSTQRTKADLVKWIKDARTVKAVRKEKGLFAKKGTPAKKAAVKKAAPETPGDIDKMTIPQLREEAKRQNKRIPSKFTRKADIVAFLKGEKKEPGVEGQSGGTKGGPIRNEPRGRINKKINELSLKRGQDDRKYNDAFGDRRTEALKKAYQAVAEGITPDELDALAEKEMLDKSLHGQDIGLAGSPIMNAADDLRAGKESVALTRLRRNILESGTRDQGEDLLNFMDDMKKRRAARLRGGTPVKKAVKKAAVKKVAAETDEVIEARAAKHVNGWLSKAGIQESELTDFQKTGLMLVSIQVARGSITPAEASRRLRGNDSTMNKIADAIPGAPAKKAVPEKKGNSPETSIRNAYKELARRDGDWVPIADLREKMSGLSREDQDKALTEISVKPGVQVIPWDNRKALTQRDRDAAVRIGGDDAHAIRIEGSTSEVKTPEKVPEGKPLWGTIKTHGFKPGDTVMFHGHDRRKAGEGRRVKIQSYGRTGYTLVDAETGERVSSFGVANRAWYSRISTDKKPVNTDKGLEFMTVAELRKKAGDEGIDIPRNLKLKKDIVNFLADALAGKDIEKRDAAKKESKHPNPLGLTGRDLTLHEAIRDSWVTHRRDNNINWAKLADIRDDLGKAGFSRSEQDDALKKIARGQGEPFARIIPTADSASLTQRDRDAAFRIGGEDNHVIKFLDMDVAPKKTTPTKKTVPVKTTGPTAAEKLAQRRAEREIEVAERKAQREKAAVDKKAEREKLAADKKAAREKGLADRRADRERLAAEKKLKVLQERQEKREKAEQDRIEAAERRKQERAEATEKRKREREARKKAEFEARQKEKRQRDEEKRLGQLDDWDSLTGPGWGISMLRQYAEFEKIKVPGDLITREEIRDYILLARIDKHTREIAAKKTRRDLLLQAEHEGIRVPDTLLVAGSPEMIARWIAEKRQELANLGIDPKKFRPTEELSSLNAPVPTGDNFTRTPSDWDKIIPHNTDPNRPFKVRAFTRPDGYRVQHGVIVRRNGITYMIETSEKGAKNPYLITELVKGFEDFHNSNPDVGLYQHEYAWLLRASPGDAHWQRVFGNPDHKALASAGFGEVNIWNRGAGNSVSADYYNTLNHEFGHNVDRGYRFSGSGEWALVGGADDQHLLQMNTRSRLTGIPIRDMNMLAMGPDPTRAWPNGITRYGKSSPAEDFAESQAYYFLNVPIAQDTAGNKYFFWDLFPERTKYLDRIFPRRAQERKKFKR